MANYIEENGLLLYIIMIKTYYSLSKKTHLSINAENEETDRCDPPLERSTRTIIPTHTPTLTLDQRAHIYEGVGLRHPVCAHAIARIVPRRVGGFGQTLRMRPPPIEKRSFHLKKGNLTQFLTRAAVLGLKLLPRTVSTTAIQTK